MFTKVWKVFEDNYRDEFDSDQLRKVCESPSTTYDFSEDGKPRIIKVIGKDLTGTDEYTAIQITRDTEDECDAEFNGQLSDGVFEGHPYLYSAEADIKDLNVFQIEDSCRNTIERNLTYAEALGKVDEYEAVDSDDVIYERGFYYIRNTISDVVEHIVNI